MKLKTYLLASIAGIVAALALFPMVGQVKAQTLTDTIARDVTPWYGEDQSTYADQNNRRGTIVRTLRFTDTSGGAWTADKNVGAALPNGALITGGYIEVAAALSPSPTNGDLSVMSAADLYSGGTNIFASAGILNTLIPTITVTQTAGTTNDTSMTSTAMTTILVTNATSYLTWDITGTVTTPTQGVVNVYLDYIQTNP